MANLQTHNWPKCQNQAVLGGGKRTDVLPPLKHREYQGRRGRKRMKRHAAKRCLLDNMQPLHLRTHCRCSYLQRPVQDSVPQHFITDDGETHEAHPSMNDYWQLTAAGVWGSFSSMWTPIICPYSRGLPPTYEALIKLCGHAQKEGLRV